MCSICYLLLNINIYKKTTSYRDTMNWLLIDQTNNV